jgi:ABC-2 type transport system ATP-binding protein
MSDEIAIKVNSVRKVFKLPHEKNNSVKSALINSFKGGNKYDKQIVLKGISFEVKKGEFFGIVGRNGSGKSTLLKMLAGIYYPTEGDIQVNGKLTPFIELGVGFNPELTGRENVFLNGALLGFNRKEMLTMYDDIVSFAEIGKFMDQKLKNYSSGMQVRLAFSIAIRAKSDILLFDEVLAVGDAAFQQKCYDMFETMSAEGRTIVLVTHDMSAVQRFCNRALLINQGKIEQLGDPGEVADKYLEQNYSGTSMEEEPEFTVSDVEIFSPVNPGKSFSLRENVELTFRVKNESAEKNLQIGLQVFNAAGAYCYGTNTKVSKAKSLSSINSKINVVMKQSFTPGTYFVTLAVMNHSASKVLQYLPKVANFNVRQETEVQGIALIDTEWSIENV